MRMEEEHNAMGQDSRSTEDRARAPLLELILGFQVSHAINVAATLGVADILASGPMTSAQLAMATQTHPEALYRLVRALAAVGVLNEDAERGFSLTPVGAHLRRDIAGSCAPMAELMGLRSFWTAWGDLAYAVRTGNTAFDHVHGRGVWEYRAQHPEEAELFDRAMAARSEQTTDAVLAACDFGRFDHVVDVGGGDGTFLARILATHPHVRGTLFDQPATATRAEPLLVSLGLAERCGAVGGNFFVVVPEGGDAYVLKNILHDWDDTAAVGILASCRRAMKPGARLIVLEHVIGPPNEAARGKFLDLHMLVMNGGRERSQEEFATLLARAGFRLTSVTPASAPISVIDGVPEDTSVA
jgi:SAM-dependent methyltransferase